MFTPYNNTPKNLQGTGVAGHPATL